MKKRAKASAVDVACGSFIAQNRGLNVMTPTLTPPDPRV
jgi:hypothetical protein